MELQISYHLEALNFVYLFIYFFGGGVGGGELGAGHSLPGCFQEGNFENILR